MKRDDNIKQIESLVALRDADEVALDLCARIAA